MPDPNTATVSMSARTKTRRGRGRGGLLGYALILPLVFFIGFLSIYPTALTFIDSFFTDNPLNPPVRFSGLHNYLSIFKDPMIDHSWGNTALYVLVGVVITTVLATVIALGLKDSFKGRGIVLAILILPWALPGVTEGIIWQWIYDPTFGVLNSVLHSVHIIHSYHVWLSSSRLATIFFIGLVQIWQVTPLATILILASLQSIPYELYDAATVDGAGWWRSTFTMTIPLIRPGLAIAVVQSLITFLNIFDQVYVLNGNASTGSSIMLQTYNTTFENLNFGEGYALSFVTVVITMLISVALLRLIYRRVDY
ncbi:carbohydrate ABC transporter permease [Alicyclobacillus fastidiosus]|uniref:Sugar ABC transporter permease n=1 Tax=Alicyclobacillus fastidiosus TaxID=392011 RepID=A0ABV5A8Q4_9BACL|nr:sugar ABC transporter permease [Alicyclobacillus fastidiosus]WEH10625.1 sugar ABC transporter permease [Alicyclobacillus fastidiosus]